MFFTYLQNNSGGGFDTDGARGISNVVIIEANSSSAARARAESIGIYFDGVASGDDCACCGDRWYAAWTGDDSPSYYSTPIAGAKPWNGRGKTPHVFIHYADGRIHAAQ